MVVRKAARVGLIVVLALSVMTVFIAPGAVAQQNCEHPDVDYCDDDGDENHEPFYDGPQPPQVDEVIDEVVGGLSNSAFAPTP
jgi:hypothetical protein